MESALLPHGLCSADIFAEIGAALEAVGGGGRRPERRLTPVLTMAPYFPATSIKSSFTSASFVSLVASDNT
jgi:hypothetical protein